MAAGCKQPEASEGTADTVEAQALPRVSVRVVALEDWEDRLVVPATLLPPAQIKVTPQIMGTVQELGADEGDFVAKGDLLAAVDPSDIEIQLGQARAALAAARAGARAARVQRDNLERQYERMKALESTQSIPTVEYEQTEAGYLAAKAQVGVADAQVKVARAGVAAAEEARDDTRILAPVGGLVVKRMVNVGEQVAPVSPMPLFVLATVDPLYAEGNAPENVFGQLREDMPATVFADGQGEKGYPGTVSLIGPAVDPVSKTVRVRVTVPNPGTDGQRELVSGMTAQIELVPEKGRYFVLPLNTVRREEEDRLVVYFVDENNVVYERKVRPVRRTGLYFLAREGVDEGARLVVAAPKELKPGDEAEVVYAEE